MPAPPYDPQALLDAVVNQRNSLMNEVAMAHAVMKAKDEHTAELEKKEDVAAELAAAHATELAAARASLDDLRCQLSTKTAQLAAITASTDGLLAEVETSRAKKPKGKPAA